MRQLIEQEERELDRVTPMYFEYAELKAFEAGFAAGLDYQQHKLDAYAAYVASKITLKELEEVLSA